MSVAFELPQSIEQQLRERLGDLSQPAKEAFLVQCYREERLSVGQVARALGRGVIETQEWLAERGAPLTYTREDLEEDRKSLSKHFPETGR